VTPLLVAAGALVGAPLRLFANRWASRNGGDPAAGTLAVNVVGSAVLGVLLGLAAVPGWVLALLGVGFCGALTTFSTFGFETVRLLEDGSVLEALLNAALSLAVGLAACALGFAATSALV
jgi:fluoride exporter